MVVKKSHNNIISKHYFLNPSSSTSVFATELDILLLPGRIAIELSMPSFAIKAPVR